MYYIAQISLLSAAIVFVFAAYKDFTTWKIPNRLIFLAVGLYIPYAVSSQLAASQTLAAPISDLAAAALLFAIGFGFWAAKLFGAGDAKLFFPIGLFLGWPLLLVFALNLVVFAVIIWLALKWPLPPIIRTTAIGMRIDEIRTTGKVPYGVVMVAALFASYIMAHYGN